MMTPVLPFDIDAKVEEHADGSVTVTFDAVGWANYQRKLREVTDVLGKIRKVAEVLGPAEPSKPAASTAYYPKF